MLPAVAAQHDLAILSGAQENAFEGSLMNTDGRAAPIGHAVAVRRRSLFFVGMAVVLALVVFAGFAPTFYLR